MKSTIVGSHLRLNEDEDSSSDRGNSDDESGDDDDSEDESGDETEDDSDDESDNDSDHSHDLSHPSRQLHSSDSDEFKKRPTKGSQSSVGRNPPGPEEGEGGQEEAVVLVLVFEGVSNQGVG